MIFPVEKMPEIIKLTNEHDRRDPKSSSWDIPHSVVNSQIVVAASSGVSDPQFVNETIEYALAKAKEVVLKDGVIVYPTDTVYGLGGNAHSQQVVDRINRIKQKSGNSSLSVIMSGMEMIKEYCEVDEQQAKTLNTYLPGPYTFLLKCRKKLPVTDNDKIGVRIPDVEFTHQLAEACMVPIITTSANITGQPPPTKVDEINMRIMNSVDLVINGGETKHKAASAVVDLVEKKVI